MHSTDTVASKIQCFNTHTHTHIYTHPHTPDKDYNDLNQSVCGELSSVCIKFPNETFTDMCHCSTCSLSPSCPIKAGTTYNMSVELPIASVFPDVSYAVYNILVLHVDIIIMYMYNIYSVL